LHKKCSIIDIAEDLVGEADELFLQTLQCFNLLMVFVVIIKKFLLKLSITCHVENSVFTLNINQLLWDIYLLMTQI